MKEKRKYRRRSLVYNLQVADRNTGDIVGRVANLSPEGVMLITTDRMVNDTVLKLSIALPEKIFDRDRIECEARCMWCKPGENTDFFEVGLQLLEVPGREIEAIVALITKYRLLD
jgi:hypothetical protein